MNIKSPILWSVVAIVLWLGGAIYMANSYRFPDWAQRGQFGDMFGVLTSLFSVLGFIGILFTLHEQRVQAEQTAKHEEKAAHDALLAVQANAFQVVYQILQAEDARKARAQVQAVTNPKILPSNYPRDCEETIKNFNTVGVLCREKYVDVNVVAAAWCGTILKCWEILHEPYILNGRLPHVPYPEAYDWLVKKVTAWAAANPLTAPPAGSYHRPVGS